MISETRTVSQFELEDEPLFMLSKEASLRLVERCFSDSEWQWLSDQSEFREALSGMTAIEQLESVIAVGLRLLSRERARSAASHSASDLD